LSNNQITTIGNFPITGCQYIGYLYVVVVVVVVMRMMLSA
jgi:hypothetical protein